jgi:hypothetical protein
LHRFFEGHFLFGLGHAAQLTESDRVSLR